MEMTGNTTQDRGANSLIKLVRQAYENGIDDYHMIPLRVCKDGAVSNGDSIVFCCRRGEREIELTDMFVDSSFDKVPIHKLDDLFFVLLTQYHEKFMSYPIAFAPLHVKEPLGKVLAENGKTQFHIAESEKYAHVTFFFNGGENEPFDKEEDCCIPSPKGIPFDEKPELSLVQVSSRVIAGLGKFDFIVVNFANGDVIGHTSNTDAKIKACKAVSENLEKVVKAALEKGYVVAITADHGNIETLYTKKGSPHVAHTTNKVAFFLLDGASDRKIGLNDGSLRDVAPTILDVLGVEKPASMDGNSLVEDYSFGRNRKALLVILDGWGLGTGDDNDAIHLASTPYWDDLLSRFAYSKLDASGKSVGLGDGKPGNSEAGHMNLGAGRCVVQDDIRIDKAIEDGTFENNPILIEAVGRSIEKKKSLHLLTYLSYKSSHGSMDYAVAICRIAKKLGQNNVFLHIIFDGRSTEPGSAPALLMELEEKLNEIGVGQIVDGIGRGFALDRDNNWKNVKLAYDLFTGEDL